MDDQKLWIDEATGYQCIAQWVYDHWSGYVVVPDNHPWHGHHYNQCTKPIERCEYWCEHCPNALIDVHGGITWSGELQQFEGNEWHAFGFDCAHAGDNPYVCNLDYATAETTRLAKQLHAFAQEQPHADH